MKFKHKRKVFTPVTEVYEVKINVMHGDADYYEDITVGLFHKDEDEDLLEDLVETLDRMLVAFPNGMSGGSSYSNIKGFNEWFCSDTLYDLDYVSTTEFEKRREDMMGDWKYNSFGDEGQIVEYEVVYFDEWGRECYVEIANSYTMTEYSSVDEVVNISLKIRRDIVDGYYDDSQILEVIDKNIECVEKMYEIPSLIALDAAWTHLMYSAKMVREGLE